MRKIIAAGLLVVAVWVGAEVNHRGVDGAFGGLFANGLSKSSAVFDAPANRSSSGRTMDAFQRAYDKSESRVERLLNPPPDENEDE